MPILDSNAVAECGIAAARVLLSYDKRPGPPVLNIQSLGITFRSEENMVFAILDTKYRNKIDIKLDFSPAFH